jgi:hypothetical protein
VASLPLKGTLIRVNVPERGWRLAFVLSWGEEQCHLMVLPSQLEARTLLAFDEEALMLFLPTGEAKVQTMLLLQSEFSSLEWQPIYADPMQHAA